MVLSWILILQNPWWYHWSSMHTVCLTPCSSAPFSPAILPSSLSLIGFLSIQFNSMKMRYILRATIWFGNHKLLTFFSFSLSRASRRENCWGSEVKSDHESYEDTIQGRRPWTTVQGIFFMRDLKGFYYKQFTAKWKVFSHLVRFIPNVGGWPRAQNPCTSLFGSGMTAKKPTF